MVCSLDIYRLLNRYRMRTADSGRISALQPGQLPVSKGLDALNGEWPSLFVLMLCLYKRTVYEGRRQFR